MELTIAVKRVLSELDYFIDNISDEDYSKKIGILNSSSLGQHVRHILEFFICLNAGYERGFVDYDERDRDKRIEVDKEFARSAIREIINDVEQNDHHQSIVLRLSYDREGARIISILTSYQRELAYNIEHSVHHMAIIRIGIEAIAPGLRLSREFGVAASTLRFQKKV